MRRLIDDLSARHCGVLSHAEVDDTVRNTPAELSRTARVTAFLPVLARRKAEELVVEVARGRHEQTRAVPKVVFVCRRKEGRSHLAAAPLDHYARARVEVRARGIEPTGHFNPLAVGARRDGHRASRALSRAASDELLPHADVVVNMCGSGDRPDVPARGTSTDAADPDQVDRAHAAFDALLRVTIAHGGTITGEHGVGQLKRHMLLEQLGADVMELNRRASSSRSIRGAFSTRAGC